MVDHSQSGKVHISQYTDLVHLVTVASGGGSHIPGSSQSCASPGFFYTANTPSDNTTALNAMFNHALVVAHVTD
jgi:hypothetical protein